LLRTEAGAKADAIADLTIRMPSQAISWLLDRSSLSLAEPKEITVNFAPGGLERTVAPPAR